MTRTADSVIAPRIGIVRPDRPCRAITDAEARVLQAEFDRRLGPTVLDLRVDGADLGRWRSSAHAAWPADVDDVLDVGEIWRADLPPLTTLFSRTVDPIAADVRRRMLVHLGVLPIERVDDDVIEAALARPIRATDLWLIVTAADHLEVSDRRVAAFRGDADEAAELDRWFDQVVAALPVLSDDVLVDRLRRSEATGRAAQRLAAEAAEELLRVQREAADRLDEIQARLAVAEERAERVRIDTDPTEPA